MEGKTIIIGGTSGIGLATAKKFSTEGFEVIIGGRDPKKLTEALNVLGNSVQGFVVDASSAEQLRTFYRKIDRFDNLILSLSGRKGSGDFSSLDLNDVRQGFEAKFWPQLQAAQLALPFISPAGSITFITAASAQAANPGTSGLAAINGALERMIPVLAVELAPLRINGISPGVIDTPWWSWMPLEHRQAAFEMFAQSSLAGRVGQPEDLANAIYALATNRFITGQTQIVDGGLILKGAVS